MNTKQSIASMLILAHFGLSFTTSSYASENSPNGEQQISYEANEIDSKRIISSAITNNLSDWAENWLNKYGSSRVSVDYASDIEADLAFLYPWVDDKNDILFSQIGYHREDYRDQANIGFGWRHYFNDNSMFGSNIFFDQDINRGHSRFGIGMEFSREYLKLSSNGYFGISDWKPSIDDNSFLEKVANGWDIKAEGWHPSYPPLGIFLKYEQYYGDAELFSKKQKDPYSVSAGVNWTPIPMLTFNAEHRQGRCGESDTSIGMGWTWRFGVPLKQQLSSDYNYIPRDINFSRYDFVDRNNNIVLQYKKKTTLSISSVSNVIRGVEGTEIPFNISVNAVGTNFSEIKWEAEDFFASGGEIVGEGESYRFKLPLFKTGSIDKNEYLISAIAVSNTGVTSSPLKIKIIVEKTVMVDISKSTITINNGSEEELNANGIASMPITITLKDSNGQPLTGLSHAIHLTANFSPIHNSKNVNGGPSLSSVEEVESGVYLSTLTAGNVSGVINIETRIYDVALPTKQIIQRVTDQSQEQPVTISLSLASEERSIQAGNATSLFVRLFKSGKPVANQQINLESSAELSLASKIITTNDRGEASVVVSGNKAGSFTISASSMIGSDIVQGKVNLSIVGNIDKSEINFRMEDGYMLKGRVSEFYIKVNDSYGNALTGRATISAPNMTITPSSLDVGGVNKVVEITPMTIGSQNISVNVDFGNGVIKTINKKVLVEGPAAL
nr:inverse autotransporter beta domain-containing protein [Vibrio parahaemolyticus]